MSTPVDVIIISDNIAQSTVQKYTYIYNILSDYRFFLSAIEAYQPTDATTNPSLILQASQKTQYAHLIDEAIKYAKNQETRK